MTEFHYFYVMTLFINFSVIAAILPITVKLNVILKSAFFYIQWKRVKDDDDSIIKEHFLFCNHSLDFENFSIITTNNNIKITLMGSLLISKDHSLLSKKK